MNNEEIDMKTKVSIIASNGGLFNAYQIFNIAISVAAMDVEVAIFFTLGGLNLIHKKTYKPLPIPIRNKHYEKGVQSANVLSISELVKIAKEMGVKMIACQLTMDVMNIQKEDIMDGIDVGSAVTFFNFSKDANTKFTF